MRGEIEVAGNPHMTTSSKRHLFLSVLGFAAVASCGCRSTVPITDTAKTGSQQLLLNSSADAVICAFDLSPLSNRVCYLDTTGLGAESKGYLPYRIREQMSLYGVRLTESSDKADVVVEAGLAAYGTDSEMKEVGITNTLSLPNLSLYIEGTQYGVAKLSMFAWEKDSGKTIWHSGTMRADSYMKFREALGAGPYYSGTIEHSGNQFQPQSPASIF